MMSKETYTLTLCLSLCIIGGYARSPSKIIDGEHAMEGEIPHQVSFQKNGRLGCGGTIIDSLHILTAAHCVVNAQFETIDGLEVVTGSIDKHHRTGDNVFPIAQMFYNAEYNNGGNRENDIAIVKLTRPIAFNDRQKPAKLPTKNLPDLTPVLASGWGVQILDEFHGQHYSPQFLQKLPMVIFNNANCQGFMHMATNGQVVVNSNQICVMPAAGSGVCFGDSGGPLTYNDEVIGIASGGIPCGKGFPDIYTNVYHYLPWIREVLSM